MRVEIVNTPSGRERVEIDLGGEVVHSLSKEDALKLADWIISLCRQDVVGGGYASPDSQYVISSPCVIRKPPACTCNAYQLENFGCKCGAKSE